MVVVVKKDHLRVAKVILAISGAALYIRARKVQGGENPDDASGSQPFGRSGRGDSLGLKAVLLPVAEFPLTVIESR